MNSIFIWTVGDVIGLVLLAIFAVGFVVIFSVTYIKLSIKEKIEKRRRNDKNHVLKK